MLPNDNEYKRTFTKGREGVRNLMIPQERKICFLQKGNTARILYQNWSSFYNENTIEIRTQVLESMVFLLFTSVYKGKITVATH